MSEYPSPFTVQLRLVSRALAEFEAVQHLNSTVINNAAINLIAQLVVSSNINIGISQLI